MGAELEYGVADCSEARELGKITRDQGGGYDLRNAMSSEEELRILIVAYQVAVHITPLPPSSCALIMLNSLRENRMKGRISRTPSFMTPKAVRIFRIVPEMDWIRFSELSGFDKLISGAYELTLRYAKVGRGSRISTPRQSTRRRHVENLHCMIMNQRRTCQYGLYAIMIGDEALSCFCIT